MVQGHRQAKNDLTQIHCVLTPFCSLSKAVWENTHHSQAHARHNPLQVTCRYHKRVEECVEICFDTCNHTRKGPEAFRVRLYFLCSFGIAWSALCLLNILWFPGDNNQQHFVPM